MQHILCAGDKSLPHLGLQHCQLPSLTQHQHFCALTDELTDLTNKAGITPKGRQLLKLLGTCIKTILDPPHVLAEQRVQLDQQQAARDDEQRVIDESPIIMLPHITNAPPSYSRGIPQPNKICARRPTYIDVSCATAYLE